MKLKDLLEKRASIATDMRAMYDKAETEERGFNSDEQQQWDAMESDIDTLDERISKAEKLEHREANMAESRGTVAGRQQENADYRNTDNEMDESAVFRSFMMNGIGELSQEERAFMQQRHVQSKEMRALGVGAGNTGGYTVPEDFWAQLEVAMKAWGGMLEVSDIIRTDTGADLPMPTLNFTGLKASIIGENAQSNKNTDTPFGVSTIGSYTYRTEVLPISYELLQDSAFSENQIIEPFSEQLGRGLNEHLTTGTGSGQPEGIVTASASGKVGTTGQTTTVIYDDFVDLEHSVDPAYRRNAKWMFHDSTLKIIKKIKDADGRPIFLPGVEGAAFNTILDYQYQINQDMPVMAANAKSILFGRLDKYKTRIVRDVAMLRLTERYADFLQVGFLLFMRADGKLLDAGMNPVKYYQNSAS